MENKTKISKLKYLYFILIFSILLISGTYAYQQLSANNSNPTGMGGCFNVNYTGQNITTSDLSTTTNYQEGSKTTVTLSKHSSCKMYTEANIYLKTNNATTAPIETVPALRYKLFKGVYLTIYGRYKIEDKEFYVKKVFFDDFSEKILVNYKYNWGYVLSFRNFIIY